jgi:hypothetical protein
MDGRKELWVWMETLRVYLHIRELILNEIIPAHLAPGQVLINLSLGRLLTLT